jgi:hypothetical protein
VNPKLALQIGAVLAIVFGLGLALLPAQMLAGFGLATPNEALIVSRDVGVTLVGVGVIDWLARDATGAVLRGILIGNLVIQVLEFLVNGYELATGALPSQAAGGEIIHVVLAVVFILALRRA